MRSALLLGLLALSAVPRALAEDAASDDKCRVTLENTTENDQPCARFAAEGAFPFLPTGTVLHVTLQVLDRLPPVEAAVLKIDVSEGGRYRVEFPWQGQLLGAIGYEARVNLHMESQPKQQKTFLSKQLGYRGNDHITLAVKPAFVGSVEERLAFAKEVLGKLRFYNDQVDKFHQQIAAAAAAAAGWEEAKASILEAFVAAYEVYRAWVERYVVWYEHENVGRVDQCFRGLEAAMNARSADQKAKFEREMTVIGDNVKRVRTDVESRLPKEGPPAPEKKPGKKE